MALLLDKDERYILAHLRSDRLAAAHWGSLITKLLMAAIFLHGFVNDNNAMIFTGFGAMLMLDLWSLLTQPKFSRSICSAITKLEARIEELESAAPQADNQPVQSIEPAKGFPVIPLPTHRSSSA